MLINSAQGKDLRGGIWNKHKVNILLIEAAKYMETFIRNGSLRSLGIRVSGRKGMAP